MSRKIANLNKGVYVMISPTNSRAIGRLIANSRRSFSTEVNLAVEQYIRRREEEQPDETLATAQA